MNYSITEATHEYTVPQEKNVRYFVFYKLEKPELIFINFGVRYPDNPG